MWRNEKLSKNTDDDNIFSVSLEWVDDVAGVFTDASPFVYSSDRLVNTVAGRNAFKTGAEKAREAERTRKASETTKGTAFLDFMNG